MYLSIFFKFMFVLYSGRPLLAGKMLNVVILLIGINFLLNNRAFNIAKDIILRICMDTKNGVLIQKIYH
jgi:hypothetical protein